MPPKAISFLLLSLVSLTAYTQNNNNAESLRTIVYTLANDSMEGRAAGTAGEIKAENYIIKRYKAIGLKPVHGSYIQKFVFPADSAKNDTAVNVMGMIDNKGDSTIIIGAHYDHIGLGGAKSRSLTNKKIHPGADDNASGVAMMLALAEHLKRQGSKKFNYLFIAFSAEEEGLYGSAAFVNSKQYNLNKVKLMLNFVMVGRLNKRVPVLKVMRSNKDGKYDSLLTKSTANAFRLHITDENIAYTDAGAFIKNNIPAISFTTGIHDDYHKTTDVAEKINYEGMMAIIEYIENFIDTICKR